MITRLVGFLMLPVRFHFWGSFAMVLVVAWTISAQVSDRHNFANGELYEDVMDRWGAPIDQAAPSVRYVVSGAVFNSLTSLPLDRQEIQIDATMNYRKRGLVYFSGFDFNFSGAYEVENPEPRDIDVVFVFPVSLNRNKVLLSELDFSVNGESSPVEMSEGADKFVWTGRLGENERLRLDVGFSGRGLESFTYRLDPSLPVRNGQLELNIRGGEQYDYVAGVVPAHEVERQADAVTLRWNYPSLESGVPLGAILPSEQAFDDIIATMVRRAWAPFLLFFAGFVALAVQQNHAPRFYESYLVAAGYGLFFVLLAYFAAFMNFYLAYFLVAIIITALLSTYCRRLFSKQAGPYMIGLLLAFLVVPTMAVIAQGYTGLIYSIEILSGIAGLMLLTTGADFAPFVERVLNPPKEELVHGE